MPATKDDVYVATLRTRKRCVNCRKMIEVGERAVLRSFTKESGMMFQRGGYIGTTNYVRTHAAHVACAEAFPLCIGREVFRV